MSDDDWKGMNATGPNDMVGGAPADEVRTLRVLIRYEGNKTYVEVAYDNLDSWSVGQTCLDKCLLDLIREGLKEGRRLSRIARRKEDAMEDRPGIIIVWEGL